jgi:DNA replication protein DnaC
VRSNLLLDEYLKKLRLPVIRGIYQKLSREASENNLSYEDYLLALVEEETLVRESNALKRRIKQAHFPYLKTLESFDFSACRIDKHKVIQLAQRSEYIQQRENVIFLGEPGLGKTHLAISLGIEGCKRGYRVLFRTAAGLINEMKEAREKLSLLSLERKLSRAHLVVVDELGFVPFDRPGAELLFEFFSSRYEQGSCVITSNLAFAHWTEVFHDQRLTGALLDRVTHHAHIIPIEGESYRFRQSLTKYKLSPGEVKEKQNVAA